MKTRRGTARPLAATVAALACVTALSGCQFAGIGSVDLPLTPGTGSGSYTVTAVMDQVGNLPTNAEVMVNDVTVGTVTAIRFDHWHARLTISLPRTVRLPANATATIGQKSLFGAEYVALGPPAGAQPAGRLRGGDVIPLSRTGNYPSTEDVLAAMSTLLNGGGLNQLSTITTELNHALSGHEQQARALLQNLRAFVISLNAQRAAIIGALDTLNALSAQLRARDGRLARAIDRIPAGLAVLNANQRNLTRALVATSRLGTVADRVLNETSQNLIANLHDLRPAVQKLADSAHNLVNSFPLLATFPFPPITVDHAFKGDYANLYLSLDLTLPELERAWLPGTPLAGLPKVGGKSGKSHIPLTGPLQLPVGSLGGGSNGSSGGSSGGLGGVLGWLLGGGNG